MKYWVRYVYGHYEISDFCGRFICSCDDESEVREVLDSME